ncbi:MAG: pilus assembly protein [Chloroflexi bacterium]|nr:pilus assembly protein [Chloroflexota bacterium]
MPGRVASWMDAVTCSRPALRRGQALVETALVVPLLLTLAFGVVAAGRVAHGQMAVSAVAREAARAAALADSAADAGSRGVSRGREVAAGYGLGDGPLDVRVEPGAFSRGGEVRASVRCDVSLEDLPLLSWARVPVSSEHVERIDTHRSRWRSERDR